MKGPVTIVLTDSESVYMHRAFAKYCQDIGIQNFVIGTVPQGTSGQYERLYVVVMSMTSASLNASDHSTKKCLLAVQHAIKCVYIYIYQ